jgi:hypothetical protein
MFNEYNQRKQPMAHNTATDAKTKTSGLKRVKRVEAISSSERIFAKLVTRVRVKPQQHKDLIIGSSMDITPPKGFSIELSPDSLPVDSVTAEVTTLGSPQRFSYALHINNSSHKTINAEIWQL